MQAKVLVLESKMDEWFPELLVLLKPMIQSGKCDLGALEKYIAEQAQDKEGVMRTIIRYAIACGANHFIENMLPYSHMLPYYEFPPLWQYAVKQDNHFKELVITTIVSQPRLLDLRSIAEEFKIIAEALMQTAPQDLEDQKTFIKKILSASVRQGKSSSLVCTWAEVLYSTLLAPSDKTINIAETINIFLTCLPDNDDQNNQLLVPLLIMFLHTYLYKNQDAVLETVKRFLIQYSFHADQIVNILEKKVYFRDYNQLSIKLLTDRLDANHPVYPCYQSFWKFLAARPEERISVMLENQAELHALPESFSSYVISDAFSQEDIKFFMEYYLEYPEFKWGPYFSRHLFDREEDFIHRYLQIAHAALPENCFSKLISPRRQFKKLTSLIEMLIKRSDYHPKHDDLFRSLFHLFKKEETSLIKIILDHPEVFNLLKRYHALNGDDQLSRECRGTLLPKVFAWYLQFSEAHPGKAKEIFFALPTEKHQQFLKQGVPSFIYPQELTLRAFILRSNDVELIEAIGGMEPRFIRSTKGVPTFFVPDRFHSASVRHSLKLWQQSIMRSYAKKKSKALSSLQVSAEVESWAQAAVKHFLPSTLILQHQTTAKNGTDILTDGILKSIERIEDDVIMGKPVTGMLNKELLNHPKRLFCFFTRLSNEGVNLKSIHDFKYASKVDCARFLLNGAALLQTNPHITFILMGPYNFFEKKTLVLWDDFSITYNPADFEEASPKFEIKIDANHGNILETIYQKMFELVFHKFIIPLPDGPNKAKLIQKLTQSDSAEDRQLAFSLLDLLGLEWMFPGNVRLHLNSVDAVELGEKTYCLKSLRDAVYKQTETEVLAAIHAWPDMHLFPFLIDNILSIAFKRGHRKVITSLMKISKEQKPRQQQQIVYYPPELYQIEPLVQLQLEDFNERVYVHYIAGKMTIHAVLQTNTNRGGAHSAQMVALYCALGLGEDYYGKDALNIVLPDNLTIKIGKESVFQSLSEVRNALLTYLLTTLLTSWQNTSYYLATGKFHPKTGHGATDSEVALMPDRLFDEDEQPYRIAAVYNEQATHLCIKSSRPGITGHIAKVIANVLEIADDKINSNAGTGEVHIEIGAPTFIAKLRNKAICYEGVNVITEDGKLLLAERRGKGLASAGGHHNDLFSSFDIAYGLQSEFGLEFVDPSQLQAQVTLLTTLKEPSKTGVYVISAAALKGTFHADPDEFIPGSECALALAQMRGKKFYDVMPLKELCHYQLVTLKNYLAEHFAPAYAAMSLEINSEINIVGRHKIPGLDFGKMTIKVTGEIPEALEQLFEECCDACDNSTYIFDKSPFLILQAIKNRPESTHQVTLQQGNFTKV